MWKFQWWGSFVRPSGVENGKSSKRETCAKPEFICSSGARQNHNHHGAALQVSLLFETFSLMLETAVKNWRLARFNLASIAPCARYRRSRIFCCCHFLLMIILRVSGSTKAIIHSRLELFSPLSPNEIWLSLCMKSFWGHNWQTCSVTWKLIALGIKVHIVFKAFQAFPLSQIKLFDIQTRLKMLWRSKNAIQADLVMQRLEFEF